MENKPYEIVMFESKIKTATSWYQIQDAVNEVYDKVIDGVISCDWISHALEFAKQKRIER
jgi:hypothetical protein